MAIFVINEATDATSNMQWYRRFSRKVRYLKSISDEQKLRQGVPYRVPSFVDCIKGRHIPNGFTNKRVIIENITLKNISVKT